MLSSVEEVLTKWKNDFAGLLAETPSSRNTFIQASEQVEKFPRNEKYDSTTLLDRCWETSASVEEVKFATIAQKNKKAPGPDELPAEVLKNDFCCSFLSTLFTICLTNCCIPSAYGEGGQ